jgi:hypothetical protein
MRRILLDLALDPVIWFAGIGALLIFYATIATE